MPQREYINVRRMGEISMSGEMRGGVTPAYSTEVKFEMGSLRDDDKYVFIKGAFDLYGIDIDIETMEDEFYALEREGYLRETVSKGDWTGDYSLTPKGIHVAEKMFEMMKTLISVHVESQPIIPAVDIASLPV